MIAVFAIIYGVVAILIFRRFTDRAAIERSVNRILAHVMELGLFLDSPGLVLGAQRDLLRENARLLRLVIVPGAILAVLFAILYLPMNAMLGYGPLVMGEPSVVTVQMKDALTPIRLEAPDGIAVETPGVRSVRDRQIGWRVRPLRQSSGDFKFLIGNRVVTPGMLLRDPAIRSIEIRYPKVAVWGVPWMVWFAAISSVSAVILGLQLPRRTR
jgi:hypothetical protein